MLDGLTFGLVMVEVVEGEAGALVTSSLAAEVVMDLRSGTLAPSGKLRLQVVEGSFKAIALRQKAVHIRNVGFLI